MVFAIGNIPHNKTHGMTNTKFYKIWTGMRKRCFKAYDKSYKNYGGRGITVCEHWLNFENFKDDMYESYLNHCEKYGEKETTIERKNINGNYEPINCIWITTKEQHSNTRKNRQFKAISPQGKCFYSINQHNFAKLFGLSQGNINKCLNNNPKYKTVNGWSFEYID